MTRRAHKPHIPKKGLSLNPNVSAIRRDSIWFSVTMLTTSNFSTYSQRQLNVEAIQRYIPKINILNGSRGLDETCCSILNELGIRVSALYNTWEMGVGWIHEGKVGHWCSFLRFLKLCTIRKETYCVWLEDDCVLNEERMRLVHQHLSTKKLILALGEGDEVNVVSQENAVKLLQFYHGYSIALPFDLATRHDKIREDAHLFDARLFHSPYESTIVCKQCRILHYKEANEQIDAYTSSSITTGIYRL